MCCSIVSNQNTRTTKLVVLVAILSLKQNPTPALKVKKAATKLRLVRGVWAL